MHRLFVTGGSPLQGSVRVSGAKNSALKLMAAAILAPGCSVVRNVPRIRDCAVMAQLLEHFGVGVELRGDARRDRRPRFRGAARAGRADPGVDRGPRTTPGPDGTRTGLPPRG